MSFNAPPPPKNMIHALLIKPSDSMQLDIKRNPFGTPTKETWEITFFSSGNATIVYRMTTVEFLTFSRAFKCAAMILVNTEESGL